MVTPRVTGSLVLLLYKAVNKQNTSKLLRYKKYFKMNLKMILKSFDFQSDFDFDFQITTSKMIWILILNHHYLGDLILILKSSTYDDFAHLCPHFIYVNSHLFIMLSFMGTELNKCDVVIFFYNFIIFIIL